MENGMKKRGGQSIPDPACTAACICRFGRQRLVPRPHGVCTILTNTDFGERNCPFWKPKDKGV